MKRRLVVLRHGAAEPARAGQPDRDRPLEDRGRAQILEVAGELVRLGWIPELALVSPARRTRETWAILSDHLGVKVEATEVAALYGAGWEVTCDRLGLLDPERRSVLVVGHNPGLEEVVAEASGHFVTLGTGSAALLAGEGRSWPGALREGRWSLLGVVVPSA